METDSAGAIRSFRTQFYAYLTPWGDALFELTGALLCALGRVSSAPSLSLEPSSPAAAAAFVSVHSLPAGEDVQVIPYLGVLVHPGIPGDSFYWIPTLSIGLF